MKAPLAAALLVLTVLLAACGPATRSAAGIVVGVDQPSLAEIRGFTLRTQNGETLTFAVGKLDLSDGAFPANHLREHMTMATAVAVAYTEEGGERIAVRLVDAPWLER